MSEVKPPYTALKEENDLLEAVTDYTYHRHNNLTPFIVEVHITEKLEQDILPIYYVSSTLMFQVEGKTVKGSTDVYQCYKCGDKWCIEWHSS